MRRFVTRNAIQRGLSVEHDNVTDIYSYMREFSTRLGERILEEYPALQSFEDPVSPRLDTLLRRPFAAQNIAIMSVAKRWEQFRTALIVAECGTGKTLMSLGAIHVHSQGKPYTALAMVPPHLVRKWAREALLTIPAFAYSSLTTCGTAVTRNRHTVSMKCA
jgi:superfamily II DNA or RNA helicase